MTEKELEKIEQRFKFYPMVFSRVEHEDAHRLIAEVRRLQDALKGAAIITNTARNELKRLEKALEFYANGMSDKGQIAQIALKGAVEGEN